MQQKEHYGLGTAISMIMGIAIGSGIFFKVDEILIRTNGNVWMGISIFLIGAFCVVFGSLSISQIASRTKTYGGVISYFEEFISPQIASAVGWFQIFIYFPILTAVVSWVAGIYTLSLFGILSTLELQIVIGFMYITFFFSMNYFSYKIGGQFQNISTIIKMIPLLGIGLVGLLWSNKSGFSSYHLNYSGNESIGWGWLSALAPMAFSFDGWIISTTITKEVKDYQKNMPIALAVGPLLVLFLYLSFFLGVVEIVGPEQILLAGDQTISLLGTMLFGPIGERLLLIFVLIAILGVVNGVSMGFIRTPQILASKEMIPYSSRIKRVNSQKGLSPKSTILAYSITVFWLIIHYLTQKYNVLNGGDLSEMAVVFGYLSYILLYLKVMKLYKVGVIKNKFLGVLSPVLGIGGSGIILTGGILASPIATTIFLSFCMFISFLGYLFYSQKFKYE